MSANHFSFKQFTIHQERCAMKVGTDGALLGAWAEVADARTILDIGTGTGLVALMAAQRSPEAFVTGIEIDAEAAAQAAENVADSPFAGRVKVMTGDVRTFVDEHSDALNNATAEADFDRSDALISAKTVIGLDHSDALNNATAEAEFYPFDAVLCNPPFFERALRCPDGRRSTARHDDTLSLDELAVAAALLLSPSGTLSVVLPLDRRDDMRSAATAHGLFPCREMLVKPLRDKAPKRILMAFSRDIRPLVTSELCMEEQPGTPTEEFKALMKDFYLKF